MPTALELTREGWRPYLEGAVNYHRPSPVDPKDQQERERLLKLVREAAGMLKREFGVQRVVLLGSLAHGAWFEPDSDVDLAVQGLTSDRFCDAWRSVEQILGDRSVDLIDMETAGGSLLKTIRRSGIEL